MSEPRKPAALVVGKPTPMPEYHYQGGWGKSVSVSVKQPRGGERKFHELGNFQFQKA